ncbi:Vacuolar protein sorting-associated protein 64 [Nakaseomyces bracarensis]|uniref:Vacuolar protein sorting-associated protein 64 n=1 Tax=Nakaseomyces bracarensis TaxID=273131 RepID=A0ABR4P047_9SACH
MHPSTVPDGNGARSPVNGKKKEEKRPMGRNRSNSRSSGSRTVMDIDEMNSEFMRTSPLKQVTAQPIGGAAGSATSPVHVGLSPDHGLTLPRAAVDEEINSNIKQFTNIIVLKSLNDTFETKFLVVPYKPDGLKLGRPVASGKAGGGSQIRPDNGNFDSRVLSRNHALLSCDPENGKIHIRDLKSSNGTFVNGERIDQSYTELKIGDTIDLGTDIDTKLEHRKISAIVEDISVIPLVGGYQSSYPSSSRQVSGKEETLPILDTAMKNTATVEPGHTVNKNIAGPIVANNQESAVSVTTAQRAAFEAAMFGDVVNVDLDDEVLGVQTEILSGIFVNNSVGTSPNLVNTIKTLTTELALEKQEAAKLKSMENFLVNFTTKLDLVKVNMEQTNEKYLTKLQDSLRQNLSEQHNKLINECLDRKIKLDEENRRLRERSEGIIAHKQEELDILEKEIKEVEDGLERERKLHLLLEKQEKMVSSSKYLLNGGTKNANTLRNTDLTSNKILVTAAVTVGIVAAALKWRPWNS